MLSSHCHNFVIMSNCNDNAHQLSDEKVVDDVKNLSIKDLVNDNEDLADVHDQSLPCEEESIKRSTEDLASVVEETNSVFIDDVDEEEFVNTEKSLTDEDREERHKQALDLKQCGNVEFNQGNYTESINSYTKALNICPLTYPNDRSIFYSNRAASKMKLNKYETAIDDCTKAISLNDGYLKAYLRRAKLYEITEKLDESFQDYKKILELDRGNTEARAATERLPPLINERNEKLKTEMLGKLKDLGNVLLRPFGLSTENFKMQQDPNTGGYSVNFQQHKS